ncbi:uncharacterized protein LOC116289861 [Actinia tenebrosa]|uniref:Uncharacterized protein LOC116289861 n=1 Tax=Actinia tenebrosa TaxID=6105 RepID=A0A6P8HC00_ACTTE|nr:uncharacterized protein LOC116289861 [Actinia tenebrosa]XP_031552652.1 uncharacterized protein LOC116289861 [Actinia tenebrosa]XP_031552653.1 uncharacterized protein LOC116289861 [Actinia tenebrosa]XP_031552654.1 uncharacterized protein LOC116289861 [Actinia tenebrosa]XP_031552655.1 uncharacterized protein LOC116289861 [Actinia tenebrosa]XP_031552657.1 uncharacterized protein LOC116289861 [Actinia tenebrosa]XP_031552658.1 uncharacterized protein LOC116289861 [Actinia tenebrosa]
MHNASVATTPTMKKLVTQKNGEKEATTVSKTISSSTKNVTSSKVVTKTTSITKTSGKKVQQFKTSESSKLFSDESWSSAIHEGTFGSTLQQQKTLKFESSSEKQELTDFKKSDIHFDDQRALHLKQGARPKTTSSSLMRSPGINTKLESSFELHPDIHIPTSLRHPSPTAFKIKEPVWQEGFSLFPEYFPDVCSAQSMRERFQRSVNDAVPVPVKETKLLSCSTKQYSWEKLDGDEESEAQKIANSWLQIFGENEPRKANKDIDRKAIKNS